MEHFRFLRKIFMHSQVDRFYDYRQIGWEMHPRCTILFNLVHESILFSFFLSTAILLSSFSSLHLACTILSKDSETNYIENWVPVKELVFTHAVAYNAVKKNVIYKNYVYMAQIMNIYNVYQRWIQILHFDTLQELFIIWIMYIIYNIFVYLHYKLQHMWKSTHLIGIRFSI